MELQEKVAVPIFTEVEKEVFLRDIYPQVRLLRHLTTSVGLHVCRCRSLQYQLHQTAARNLTFKTAGDNLRIFCFSVFKISVN